MRSKFVKFSGSQSGRAKAESGQAIILIALMMIALLGMAGIVVDGGGLYFLHRDTQNATDAALLAATYARCTGAPGAEIVAAGKNAAAENGFNDNGTTNWVTINNPPLAGEEAGDINFVEVSVRSTKPTFFIQFVYGGQPLEVTSYGVGKCTPARNAGLPDAAIIALNATACGGVRVTGNGYTRTHNAGTFVNSDASEKPNNDNCDSVTGTGNGSIKAEGAGLQAVGNEPKCLEQNGSHSTLDADTTLTCGMAPISTNPFSGITPPTEACAGPALPQPGGTTITPGHYNDIKVPNGSLTFEPGIYCIHDMQFTGGTITGTNVVIYMPPGSGGLQNNGNASVQFQAPSEAWCAAPENKDLPVCEWPDLMLWSDATGDIHINGGGSGDDWKGVVYAPAAECRLEGTGGGFELHGQVICDIVDLNGNGNQDIYYVPAAFLNTPPSIAVAQ